MRSSRQRRLPQVAPYLVGDDLHDLENTLAFLLSGLWPETPDEGRCLQWAARMVDADRLLHHSLPDWSEYPRHDAPRRPGVVRPGAVREGRHGSAAGGR